MLLGGRVGDMEIEFGEKATKLPAKTASEAVVRVVERFAGERRRVRRSATGSTAPAVPPRSAGDSSDLDVFPTPEENPDFYVDFDETGPYEKQVGESECAT